MLGPLTAISTYDDGVLQGVGHSNVEKVASVPADVLTLAVLVVVLVPYIQASAAYDSPLPCYHHKAMSNLVKFRWVHRVSWRDVRLRAGGVILRLTHNCRVTLRAVTRGDGLWTLTLGSFYKP